MSGETVSSGVATAPMSSSRPNARVGCSDDVPPPVSAGVVSNSKPPPKRAPKRPKQHALNHARGANGPHPPRNAAPRNAPYIPTPTALLLKKPTITTGSVLHASAPEFVPHSISNGVAPLGLTSAWPSLPKPPERGLPTPRLSQVFPVERAAPPVVALHPDDRRPAPPRPDRTKGATTHSPALPKKPLIHNNHHSSLAPRAAPVIVEPPPPNADGAHYKLLRMYQEGKLTAQKGRQRVTPRKKKFSSLKKKVLDERLRQWKSLQGIPETAPDAHDAALESHGTTLCVYGFCTRDELVDDDEYEEIVDNLRTMASKIGATKRVFVPRSGSFDDAAHWPVFVQFDDSGAPAAAMRCWTGLVLGGQTMSCRLMPHLTYDGAEWNDEGSWCNACLAMEASWTAVPVLVSNDRATVTETMTYTTILLDHALTEEDLDDEECLAESLNDIRSLACKYGDVESLQVQSKDDLATTQVRIVYRGDARRAVAELNQVVIGGQQLVAVLETDGMNSSRRLFGVLLQNIIAEDDLEDESCLEESLNDVRELAMQFGRVENVDVEKPSAEEKKFDPKEYSIQLFFATLSEAQSAVMGFDGMVIGGCKVAAAMDDYTSEGLEGDNLALDDILKNNGREPMYSGDKLIPERFAECKRAPKVAGRSSARPYAKLASDETIKTTIIEMLSELMRLQRRALEENNVKAKRRLVMGLREVARGIRAHKVKLVIMANNLDEYGVIDATVQSIIDLAQKEEVPIYYELNKKALGKAVGKSIKVAVVGVQSPEGAHQQYKKLMSYASNFG